MHTNISLVRMTREDDQSVIPNLFQTISKRAMPPGGNQQNQLNPPHSTRKRCVPTTSLFQTHVFNCRVQQFGNTLWWNNSKKPKWQIRVFTWTLLSTAHETLTRCVLATRKACQPFTMYCKAEGKRHRRLASICE